MERNEYNEERFSDLTKYGIRNGRISRNTEEVYSDESIDILEEEDVLNGSDIAFMRGHNDIWKDL